MTMRIKRLNDNAILPTLGSPFAAGYDLYSIDTVTISPQETKLIHTGLAIEIPDGFWGGIYARSGLATKKDLAPANKVGVIDSDYRGEIMVALHNHGTQPQTVMAGDRIAQLVFHQQWTTDWEVVDELSNTSRGEGGFGSTGKN
jgi:dUTP pyrophosphatase